MDGVINALVKRVKKLYNKNIDLNKLEEIG
jgi:hypothetical protein